MAMPISSVAAEYAPKVLWSSMYRECTSNVSVWDTPGETVYARATRVPDLPETPVSTPVQEPVTVSVVGQV